MPPKKKGTKKKSKKEPLPPLVIKVEPSPPLTTDPRSAVIFSTVVASDFRSLNRLVTHYDYEKVLSNQDANGSTAIHVAVLKNDIKMVQTLIQFQKIDVNAMEVKEAGGKTALHYACSLMKIEAMKLLLENGANPNLKANSIMGETALHICCKLGYTLGVQLLLSFGALADVKDNFGNSPSFWAYKSHHDSLIKETGLPPPKAATPDDYLEILKNRIPNFTLPTLKKKKGKDKKGK